MIKTTTEYGSTRNTNDPTLLLENALKGKFTVKEVNVDCNVVTKTKLIGNILAMHVSYPNLTTGVKCFNLKPAIPEEVKIVNNEKTKNYKTIDAHENFLLVSHKNHIEVFDINKRERIKTCLTEPSKNLNLFIYIKSCKNGFFASNDNNIGAFDYSKNKEPINKITPKKNLIEFMKIAGNNLFLAYINAKITKNKYTLEMWNIENIENPKYIKKFSFKTFYQAERYFNINENVLCSFEGKKFTLLNIESEARIKVENAPNKYTFAKVDGDRLFKGFREIEVWDIANFKNAKKPVTEECFPSKKITLIGHENWIYQIKVAGNFLVSTTRLGKETRVWNIGTGECLQTFDNILSGLELSNNRIVMHVLESDKERIQSSTTTTNFETKFLIQVYRLAACKLGMEKSLFSTISMMMWMAAICASWILSENSKPDTTHSKSHWP